MSFTIHPFCENGSSVPRNCVHAGPVSLGLLPKDYKADTAQLWRAGINPSTNLLVASTTFSRGLVGSAATSTPRYWWISGPINDQATLEASVKEVVGRLPERAPNNYVPFSDYATAYEWAKSNGYALINCNYPDYRLGDYDSTTESLINIEAGFLPSYDGSQAKLRNLANPTPAFGFGTNNPYAVPHDAFDIGSPGILGSLNTGIGTEGGIFQLIGSTRITQQSNPIINGITEGIIFEAVVEVPDGSSSAQYVLLHARDASNSTLFELGFDGASSGFYITFGGTTAYAESPFIPPGPATGTYYFCAAIPKGQTASAPVTLWSNTGAISLAEVGGGLSWNTSNVRFTFGSRYDGGTASRQVTRFFSAKVHNITSAWNTAYADDFRNQNWPIVQTLYGI
jgi:hypothetical protein